MKVEQKAWTFLFYNAGHQAQAAMSTYSLDQLEKVGSDANTDVVALNYRNKPWFEAGRFGDYEGSRTYHVERRQAGKPLLNRVLGENAGTLLGCGLSGPHKLKSKVIDQSSENPGSAATLKKFLVENMERFPAQRFALIISGHGAAFQGQAIVRGAEGKTFLSNDDLGRVLREVKEETGQGLDLVNLNTCYSANLETLYSLRDSTHAVVASQDTVALGTQPFAAVLESVQKDLAAGQSIEAPELARRFVAEAGQQPLGNIFTPTLSAFEAGGLTALGASVAALQSTLQQSSSPASARASLANALQIEFSDEVALTDIGSWAAGLAGSAQSEVKSAAQKVQRDLAACRLAEQHATPERQSLTARAVHALRFVAGPGQDYTGASGLTMFANAQDEQRLELIEASQYGRAHSPRAFLQHLKD